MCLLGVLVGKRKDSASKVQKPCQFIVGNHAEVVVSTDVSTSL